MTGMRFQNATADNAELVIIQGKSLRFQLVWGASTPINVTGFTARLSVRPNFAHTGVPTADFTVQNNRVSVGSADGKFTFSMDATTSAALPAPFSGVYEIEVTEPDGTVHRAVSGTATILPEVVK
jgi:hypothetical protein